MALLQRIRQKILDQAYYISTHAEEKLDADDFVREDVEHAILHGLIESRQKDDPRGTRYRVVGPALNGRAIGVVSRFDELGDLIIITVYAKE